MRSQFLRISAVAALVCSACGVAAAADFHVDSKVFKVGEQKPIIETTTVFVKGTVYDFLSDPNESRDPEVTILDTQRQRFIVIDPQRKLKTEVKLEDVTEFTKNLRLGAAGAKDPILNFLANPQFVEKVDGDQLEFSSSWMIYRLKTMPSKSEEISKQYAEFSHWHGQLNVMVNPGSLPPFGRMLVNKKLEELGVLPTEIYMTLSPKGPERKLIIRAEHRFQWTLLESDRKKVDDAQRQFSLATSVTLEDYNKRVEEVAEKPKEKGKKGSAKR